jgi:glycosyltransferase involved in cell wall biosynthesis
MRLLHIIPGLGAGGPTRSLLTLIKCARASHATLENTVVSLQPGDYMPLLFELRRHGAHILRTPAPDRINAEISSADVVLLHFWNTPAYWRFLTSDLPAARYVLWTLTLGAHAPQNLNGELAAAATRLVMTAPSGKPGKLFQTAPIIPGLADGDRMAGFVAKAHQGFNADYIGTTNRGKMHPRYIEMMAAVDIPDVKVRICGGALEPAMASALAASPDPERFDCRGFVENIGGVLETSDVFAYALAERTYASSDISLQEAMLAGVPAVILPHGGPTRFVTNGENGIVAKSEDEFVAAIEYLYRNPEERRRLGRNARSTAQTLFAPAGHVTRFMEVIGKVASQPPSRLSDHDGPQPMAASALFLMSQDWSRQGAMAAVNAWRAGRTGELTEYARTLHDDAFQVEGGILHWRKQAMDDPLLRYWSAIWLLRHGRIAEARQELAEALRLGAPAAVMASVSQATS